MCSDVGALEVLLVVEVADEDSAKLNLEILLLIEELLLASPDDMVELEDDAGADVTKKELLATELDDNSATEDNVELPLELMLAVDHVVAPLRLSLERVEDGAPEVQSSLLVSMLDGEAGRLMDKTLDE